MTALQEISQHPGSEAGIRLFIKRDDLIHPVVAGNKWRKLGLLLDRLQAEHTPGIVTFGGPFSNHLHAVAAAGNLFNIKTIGVVRGEHVDLQNPTLAYAQSCGMRLFPVSKKEYDLGESSVAVTKILQEFPDYYVLPEGGSTPLGVAGCAAIGSEILGQVPDRTPDTNLFVCVPAGTGCTAAGVLAGLQGRGVALVFPAAPYGIDSDRIKNHLRGAGYPAYENFKIIHDYIFGGFARWSADIEAFTKKFQETYGILPDPVYTAKMLYGVFDLLEKGFFSKNSTVVAVHTGGLQGWDGYNRR